MRKWNLVIIVCLITFGMSGCDDREITPEQMKSYGSGLESITEQIKVYQQLVSSYTELMQQTGALDVNDVKAVNALISQADKVTPELQKIANALKDGNYSDNKGLITLLEGLKSANEATSGFNKYWPAIEAVIIIAIAILGWLARNKANLATTTLGAVAKAVETIGTQPIVTKIDAEGKVIESVKAGDMIKATVKANLSAAQITEKGKALISQVKAA